MWDTRKRLWVRHGFTPNPRQVGTIEDLEPEAKALLELGLPLFENRRRRADDDRFRLLAQQQLAGNQARFDRLAEASVVGDEQTDAREPQRLAKGLHLISVNLDPGTERGLEQRRVGGRDAVPTQRVEEGCELARSIEALGGEVAPALFHEDTTVQLVVPKHVKGLALGVVVGAGQAHKGRTARRIRLDDVLDEPLPGADLYEVAADGGVRG